MMQAVSISLKREQNKKIGLLFEGDLDKVEAKLFDTVDPRSNRDASGFLTTQDQRASRKAVNAQYSDRAESHASTLQISTKRLTQLSNSA